MRAWELFKVAALVGASIGVGIAACTNDFDKFKFSEPGSGGATTTTTTSTTGGSGGAGQCDSEADCLPILPKTDCKGPKCENKTCVEQFQAVGTPCDEGAGNQVCDGKGACVQCVTGDNCKNGSCGEPCTSGVCDPMTNKCLDPQCTDGVVNGGETDVDCGGNDMAMGMLKCPRCKNDKKCKEPTDCESKFCGTPTMGAGGGGGAGGMGAGGAGDTCQPCGADVDCGTPLVDHYCDPGADAMKPDDDTCLPKKMQGQPCGGDSHCLSGHCPPQDKVCCDDACTNPCEACLKAKTGPLGTDGVCDFVPKNDDPDAECADTGAASCGPIGMGCDGLKASCILYAAGTACKCDAAANQGSTCDGLGVCGSATTCGNFVCDVAALKCKTTCAADADCTATSFCCLGTTDCAMADLNKCLPKKMQGATCKLGGECTSTFCTDGFCCNEKCDVQCRGCAAALTNGVDGTCANIKNLTEDNNAAVKCETTHACNGGGLCRLKNGQPCAGDPDCLSNACADSVCCTNSCGGTCRACNLAGSVGTCNNIPNGQDPIDECPTGTADCCNGNAQCGGTGCVN
jgi:hypothetical protein